MSYTHLSIALRSKLEILHQQGNSARAIARKLGRHPATICRELRRNESQDPYRAERSQESYVQRRKSSIPAGKWTSEQAAVIEEKLQETWSPEQIVQRLRQGTRDRMLQNHLSLAIYRSFGERRAYRPASQR
ncbi:hypothetical protein D3C74_215300 [compost metagenome]